MENNHLLIGITGGSGSGKTSLMKALKAKFSTEEVCFIAQDDYYRPRDAQKRDKHGIKNFDRPKSIDKHSFYEDIVSLIQNKRVERNEYTFNNDLVTPGKLIFDPAPVIIVEGIFVLHFKQIRKLLDIRVFLHAKENLKVIRRIKRDQLERNYPLDDVLYRYEHHVLPTFEKYILPYIDDCDIIINNNRQFDVGLDILSRFIRQWLSDNQSENVAALPSNERTHPLNDH